MRATRGTRAAAGIKWGMAAGSIGGALVGVMVLLSWIVIGVAGEDHSVSLGSAGSLASEVPAIVGALIAGAFALLALAAFAAVIGASVGVVVGPFVGAVLGALKAERFAPFLATAVSAFVGVPTGVRAGLNNPESPAALAASVVMSAAIVAIGWMVGRYFVNKTRESLEDMSEVPTPPAPGELSAFEHSPGTLEYATATGW